jgi:probable rRNA maturation factor
MRLSAYPQFSAVLKPPAALDIQACLQSAADVAAGDRAGAHDVVVRFVDAEEGRALNATYGGKDMPTNVLAFPAESGLVFDNEPAELGDIVICMPVVQREAEIQAKELEAHLSHLLVHGTLHLLGFRHDHDAEAEQMEKLEARVMGVLGFANPYATDN